MARATVPRRILVIGGGPAGLEAARLLAAAGHDVTVWEAEPVLGGRLSLAARCTETSDRFLGWLLRSVDQAGVKLEVGRTATVDDIGAFGADEVIVATGASWATEGAALTVDDLRPWLERDSDLVGDRVVIWGADVPGMGLAELCVARGRAVALADPTPVAGQALGLPGRFRRVHDLQAAGVQLWLAADRDEVFAGQTGATLIDAMPAPPLDSGALTGAIAAAGMRVHTIGDAARVDFLEGALRSATEVAQLIGSSKPS